jgi:AcrR family transcriptional regulator
VIETGQREALYPKLSGGRRRGLSESEVAANQRMRLRGAVIEAVATRGCDRLTGVELCRLAGVSKHTLYEHFPDGVAGCLRATCESVIGHTAGELSASVRAGDDWQQRVELVLVTVGATLAAYPKGARLVLFDAFDAPLVVLEAINDGAGLFEELLGDCFFDAPAGEDPPPLLLKGIVLGCAHVARAHLLSGREAELPECAPALATWARACCAAPTAARHGSSRRVPSPVPGAAITAAITAAAADGSRSERLWLLGACARLVGEEGHEALTPSRITAAAGLPRGALRKHFEGPSECLIAAYELICRGLLTRALAAAGRGAESRSSTEVGRIVARLTHELAADPLLTRLAFAEILSQGTAGVAAQTHLLEDFSRALHGAGRQQPCRADALALSAATGAIWGLIGHLAVSGRAARLPANASVITRLALAGAIKEPCGQAA